MIQTLEAPRGGAIMFHAATPARRRSRKRALGVALAVSMAVTGALVNVVQSRTAPEAGAPVASTEMTPHGPFSFFPH
jgi:hypothetical protein